METIETYLNNVFAAYPKSGRLLSLKREMLADMEDKYHALKMEGKSENEAIGSVIANFGSIDEIAAELELEQSATAGAANMTGTAGAVSVGAMGAIGAAAGAGMTDVPGMTGTGGIINSTEPRNTISLSRDEAYAYIEHLKKCGRWIGVGVWLVIAGVAAYLTVRSAVQLDGFSNGIGLMILFVAIAAAVVIFIINGLSMSRFESYSRNGIQLEPYVFDELSSQSAHFMPRFAATLATALAIIILGVGFYVVLQEVLPLNSDQSLGLMLFCIGFAVFLIISASIRKSALDTLLGHGGFQYKAQYEKAGRIIGVIASVFWPLVIAAYLLWSFLSGSWAISWIIWPIAGILFGMIAGGIGSWYYTREASH